MLKNIGLRKTSMSKIKTLKRKPQIKGRCGSEQPLSSTKHRRRDKLCIMADIIEIAREGALKTQIMYKANLSFTQLNNYISFLLSNNLIAPAIYDGREGYMVTAQGLDFLQKHSELIQMLKTYGGIKKTAGLLQNIPKRPNVFSATFKRKGNSFRLFMVWSGQNFSEAFCTRRSM